MVLPSGWTVVPWAHARSATMARPRPRSASRPALRARGSLGEESVTSQVMAARPLARAVG